MKELENLRKDTNKHKYTAKDRQLFEKIDQLKEKYEEFLVRLDEIEKSESGAKELIEETIIKMYNDFERYFIEYFKLIVPNGEAKIKLLKNYEGEKSASKRKSLSDNIFGGIEISVFFNKNDENDNNNHEKDIILIEENKPKNKKNKNKKNETREINNNLVFMENLSGGQKTVVAIVMIMALQRCDPAPFYIFDEMDAALDFSYRENITKIINDNSENAQYFITTFKPELTKLEKANFYKVFFENKISRIKMINQEEVHEIIKSDLQNKE